MRDTEDRKA